MATDAEENVEVGIAQLAVVSGAATLTSYSLGSCVALALYDSASHIAGLAHVMLPTANPDSSAMPAKSAERAVPALLGALEKAGARRRLVKAKLIGGASLFNPDDRNGPSIGERNVTALKEQLTARGIRLVAEDTGGGCARTVVLSARDGTIRVRTVARGEYDL